MTLAPKRVAVIGGGIMGSGIAALFANQGIPVFLFELDEAMARRSLEKLADPAQKIQQLYSRRSLKHITPAAVASYPELLPTCDVIVEVVPEVLSLKQKVMAAIDEHRAPGSIVSTNTSGLSLQGMLEGRSEDLRRHFLGTHYFHPVRYMPLVELIPGPETKAGLLEDYAGFLRAVGKRPVAGRDTPNFIANRIGVYALNKTIQLTERYRLPIELVDAITGPPLANPKTATFRLADLVGLDTVLHVLQNSHDNCPEDEVRADLAPHAWLRRLVEAQRFGEKTGEGFYKKAGKGKHSILVLDPETLDYRPQDPAPRADRLRVARDFQRPGDKIKALVTGPQDDPVSSLARELVLAQGAYALNRLGEVADDIATIDDAMRWGFGRELGPIESLDAVGLERVAALMEASRIPLPAALKTALDGPGRFYAEGPAGERRYFAPGKGLVDQPRDPRHLSLPALRRQGRVVRENLNARLIDLGDGALLAELDVKTVPNLNPVDDYVLEIVEQGHELCAAGEFKALVIGNQAQNFCAGANLAAVLALAQAKRVDVIDAMAKKLQDLAQRGLHAPYPVVAAPHGMALGGGLELALGAQVRVAHAELYCGLVEVGVGLVPAGGGCLRLLQLQATRKNARGGPLGAMQRTLAAFDLIAFGKVSASAEDAKSKGLIAKDDVVCFSKEEQVLRAKEVALARLEGFQQRAPQPVDLPGETGYLVLLDTIAGMSKAGQITPHAGTIARVQARILSGGKEGSPVAPTDPQRILDLEREGFCELVMHPLTQARMDHMLRKGKPLFN
ncbi:MAG: 3-hydroxyacyl-CoA dehydrogenase NAD-binding domain-containing protein [Planctomycetota bacterium]